MNEIQYIDTKEKLNEFCGKISNEPWIAIDTEFLREKTYFPKFCLLQIATLDWVACVDPLTLPSLDQLFEVIYKPSIVKVFHSCRQDMEIFFHLYGKVPEPVFDTQLAAPLLGIQENPGYAMLVSSMLSINLSKAHTRTDWSLRPLTKEQLQYAADDVIYLGQIYMRICKSLADLGRLEWLEEDFAALSDAELYLPPPEKAWLKIKGKNKLTGKQLSVLQALAKWREETAQQENRPRNWLLRDDLLLDIAKQQPATVTELGKMRSINERVVKRYGHIICRLLHKAIQRPPIKLDTKKRPAKISQSREAVLDVLSAIVRIRADENALNPVILATRKDLELFLAKDQHSSLLHGWRYSMVGKELISILQGNALIALQPDRVNIKNNEE